MYVYGNIELFSLSEMYPRWRQDWSCLDALKSKYHRKKYRTSIGIEICIKFNLNFVSIPK